MQNGTDSQFKSTLTRILLLVLAFAFYSSESVFTKLASIQEPFSLSYFLYFGCVVAVLGAYAMIWQKVLELMPLSKAFLFKSTTIIGVLLISHFVFGEVISLRNGIGAAFILSGLVVLSCKE